MIDPKMAKEIQDAFGYGLKEISQFNSFCDDHLKIIEYCQNIALNLALCSIYEMQEDDLSVRCPFPKALPFGESGGLGGTHIVLVGGENYMARYTMPGVRIRAGKDGYIYTDQLINGVWTVQSKVKMSNFNTTLSEIAESACKKIAEFLTDLYTSFFSYSGKGISLSVPYQPNGLEIELIRSKKGGPEKIIKKINISEIENRIYEIIIDEKKTLNDKMHEIIHKIKF